MKKERYAKTQEEAAEMVASFVRDGCNMVTMTRIKGETIDQYAIVGFMEEFQNGNKNAN